MQPIRAKRGARLSRQRRLLSAGVLASLLVLIVAGVTTAPAELGHRGPLAPGGDTVLGQVNHVLRSVLFFDMAGGTVRMDAVDRFGRALRDANGTATQRTVEIPFLLVVLIGGVIALTVQSRFVNFFGVRHAIDIVRGKLDRSDAVGEISHFAALMSALGQAVGLGNIAGVAVAITAGGPGAVFWMIVYALLGMGARFVSCTLSQLYRKVNRDGSISGGPMYYLDYGLRGGSLAKAGKALSVLYALMLLAGAFGGGNMFQANQTVEAMTFTLGLDQAGRWLMGLALAAGVTATVFGGLKSIANATSKIVPAMCVVYVCSALAVVFANLSKVPEAVATIVSMAFSGHAFFGGVLGTLLVGAQRSAFSNGAGLGSASIVHAAAKTEEPVRVGLVGMLAPLIDTLVVCVATALAIVITGAWELPAILTGGHRGVGLTAWAFGSVASWLPVVMTGCVVLFAYSTTISWCYYGEQACIYLARQVGGTGDAAIVVFRVIFVAFVFIGAVGQLDDVLMFSDMAVLCMAFPNIIGCVLLAPRARQKLDDYWARCRRVNSNSRRTVSGS